MKFLVVDDSATVRRLVARTLRQIGGAETVEAADGREALERFDDSVDLVVAAWGRLGGNAVQLARALRARPDGARVPILATTPPRVMAEIIDAMAAGISHCLFTPFTPAMLHEKVAQLLPNGSVR